MQILNVPKAFWDDEEVEVHRTESGLVEIAFLGEDVRKVFWVALEEVEITSVAVLQ